MWGSENAVPDLSEASGAVRQEGNRRNDVSQCPTSSADTAQPPAGELRLGRRLRVSMRHFAVASRGWHDSAGLDRCRTDSEKGYEICGLLRLPLYYASL